MEEFMLSYITGDVTGYRLADILTKVRGSLVRPQMIYAYCAKPANSSLHIASYRNEAGKQMIEQAEAVRFAVKYLSKNAPELLAQV